MPKPFLLTLLLAAALVGTAAQSQSEQPKTGSRTEPNPSAGESEVAGSSIEYRKWTPNVNVPDPISISMDDRGRAYVTQTLRRKSQDLDIRNNRDWIPDDVGFQSVEDKRSFFREQLSPENSAANAERVQDLNEDGSHDWRDLTQLSEIIHLVEDSDNDGLADRSHVFAEDFKTEVTGIAAGVLWYDDDVYATIAPDVWKLKDTDGDDIADERQVIATGFGLHIAYGGHDMHGLIVGPDGKIYWSIGDKGISVTSPEGKQFNYPNQGGIMRCNPDGSDFEVFAHGLRNVQEFAFDQFGNWFGVDNDSDQPGEKERFVYIVDGMDAGWRNNFQYRAGKYNPWMDEDMQLPAREGQAAYLLPPIRNYVDGPAGFVRNPGTALSPRYRDYFFLNSTLEGKQYAFRVEQNGASFKMVDEHSIGGGRPLIGLSWGPDGALYTVDWGGGYPLNQTGAIWKLDTPGANQSIRQEVQQILSEGAREYSSERLDDLLAHDDQRIRLKAQFELVERGETDRLLAASENSVLVKRVHATWGLGQLARQGSKAATKRLATLLGDGEPEIQVQAAKVLADLEPDRFDRELLIPLLSSPHPRVRFQAGLSVGRQGVKGAFDEVVAMIEENAGQDTYLRHAGIVALAGTGGAASLVDHPSEEVRLVAVVALRRAADPAVANFLLDSSETVVAEAARAIHDDFSIPESLPSLAQLLDQSDSENEPLIRRAINANFRLGGSEEASRVAEFAVRSDKKTALRREALTALAEWLEPPLLDRVDGRRRYLELRNADEIAKTVRPELASLLKSDDKQILEKAVAAANQLSIKLPEASLQTLLKNKNAPGSLRELALLSLDSLEAVSYALSSDSVELRMSAAKSLAKEEPEEAVDFLIERVEQSDSTQEKQLAIGMLATLETESAKEALQSLADDLSSGELDPALQLDVIEAATQREIEGALAAFEGQRPQGEPTAPYVEALQGGDSEAGKTIAATHLGAQCARCHRFGDDPGSGIGPNLAGIGSRHDREYLLRALVDPGADIAKGFGMISVTLASGKSVTGQIGQEDESGLEIILADGTAQRIDPGNIESRTETISSMPPMGYLLTKRELRDLVAYLSSLE